MRKQPKIKNVYTGFYISSSSDLFFGTRGLLIHQKTENEVEQTFDLWYIKSASKAISVIKVSEGDYEWKPPFVVFFYLN